MEQGQQSTSFPPIQELKNLSDAELAELAEKIRRKIIDTVSRNGGHLAPSLGVVELTLAILAEFDLEKDKLVWDVGHQTYAYKILTGRDADFHSLRKLNGISGFPKIDESQYDHFGTGHSSTSISAALGMAVARDLQNRDHHVLAVLGDGALTGGEALEGLNLAGHAGKRLIVILNDNEMSISTNVGAISLFLSRALSSKWLRQARKEALNFLRGIPRIGQKLALYAMRGEWSFKSFFTPGMLFEAFRFTYIGPIKGHDIGALRRHLKKAASIDDGPVLVHVRTRKGKGYDPAEKNPTLFHGVGPFDKESGKILKKTQLPSFTRIFSETLLDLAGSDEKIIAITAAMPEGTGTADFSRKFPDRFVDAGICEQHAVTFAAGLASQGYKPVLAIYSTFLQRGYDQILHDVSLQNLPVIFCIDRAGLVGEDGPTHHGVFDISYLRHIPNMSILAPRDENLLRHCLFTALQHSGPIALRYPRGQGFGVRTDEPYRILPRGKGELLQDGKELLIIAAGNCVWPAMDAAREIEKKCGIRPAVYDPIWIKPLPEAELTMLAKTYRKWLIVEDGVKIGGFGSGINDFLASKKLSSKVETELVAIPDQFIQHGTQAELRELAQLDSKGIFTRAMLLLSSTNKTD